MTLLGKIWHAHTKHTDRNETNKYTHTHTHNHTHTYNQNYCSTFNMFIFKTSLSV